MASAEAENAQVFALEAAACALADSHAFSNLPPIELEIFRKLPQLTDWLDRVKTFCAEAGPEHARVADWILDNDFLILRAIRQVSKDLPRGFYRQLPALQGSGADGIPRIFAIAYAALRSMHKSLAFGNLVSYINAYQLKDEFRLAELWAIPSMLRLAALETLGDAFQQLANNLAPPYKISSYGIEDRLTGPLERISQAITNLRAISAIDWNDFVELTSKVEKILGEDPAECYPFMNFETRNEYRQSIENLAKGSNWSETAIASQAIELAAKETPGSRGHHVGFWLIDRGREVLESALDYHMPLAEWLHRRMLRHAGIFYTLVLGSLILLMMVLPVVYLAVSGAELWGWISGLLLSLLPATVLADAVSQWIITNFLKPHALPALDYHKGIPSECKTAVVVPVIISHEQEIAVILERLEIRHLSNPDPMLHYVLLSDLPDASLKTLPEDEPIETGLTEGIIRLNRKYGVGTNGPFFLLHRARHFNPAENCWMGRERKRGKLQQFNRLILNGELGEFVLCEGDTERLRDIRFVITLDADTTLPPCAAEKLVGTMMHPLNRAELDLENGQVVSGYSVIQPRLEVLPLSGPGSLFCRFFAGDTAIDIYSRAVSDVYQDVFSSGTYVGKGIYEVYAFQSSLENRIPEGAILSHDLIEGVHASAALASSIILYENFPSTYPEYALRLHRWIRGDWQLIPWLRSRVQAADGSFTHNILSGLDRWKIIDNLRRSLFAPALFLLFVSGWTVLPGSPWFWTVLATLSLGVHLVGTLFSFFATIRHLDRFVDYGNQLLESCGRWCLSIAFLVSDAVISFDAICRTLWRVLVSRQNLLQWRAAAHVQTGLMLDGPRISTWKLMWPSALIAVSLALELGLYYRDALVPAIPVLLLWLIAPEIAIWVGQPRELRRQKLNSIERVFLQKIARRTWFYFETFAGPLDNWLPPDNFQEEPKGEVAHRTSPTNIGLLLTSSMMAYDSGFIGIDDFVVRMRNSLDSLQKLKTYRGHVLNWHDTRSLEPLAPQYISTVDSGNLAVCLIALKQGCIEYLTAPVCGKELWSGLACTFTLLAHSARELSAIDLKRIKRLEHQFKRVFDESQSPNFELHVVAARVSGDLWPAYEQAIADGISSSKNVPHKLLAEVYTWLERFRHGLIALRRQLDHFCPWLDLAAHPPSGYEEFARKITRELSPLVQADSISERAQACIALVATRRAALRGDSIAASWLNHLDEALHNGLSRQRELRNQLEALAQRANDIAFGMDFSWLYDAEVRLFRIGYNVSNGLFDPNHYDLLASEARMASFYAIAKRDVPMEHWFSLGRPIARLRGRPVLLSWSGSMFEYLMPALFIPSFRDTLLGESESMAVRYQYRYAKERGVPWGISESAFSVTDADGSYQYKAFGVPGLGLRRGLSEELVIAPYAAALALSCWPQAAVKNLTLLERIGSVGIHGFIDALDFTSELSVEGEDFSPVKAYMAHHQGMILVAIANALNDDIFVRRVMSEKQLRTFDMLLQERIPREAFEEKGRIEEAEDVQRPTRHPVVDLGSWLPSSAARVSQMQMLGNGRMATWLSASGAGRLSWRGFALTRWLPDPTRDCHGYWVYLKDLDSGVVWSAGRSPTGEYEPQSTTVFHPHKIEFVRRHQGITVRMEVCVAPDDDVDIRRITVINETEVERTIDFTSYAEVVLAAPLEDERHRAFSKMFVYSEFHTAQAGLLFTRRQRRPELPELLLLHKVVFDSPALQLVGHESDRGQFFGYQGDLRNPPGVENGPTGTTGWTLDPIMSLTVRAQLQPNEVASFALLTLAGHSRTALRDIAQRYPFVSLDWVFADAARTAAREVARLQLDPTMLPDMQVLASLLVQPHAMLRAVPEYVQINRYGQEDLWQFGLSGDLPVLVLRMTKDSLSGLLQTLIRVQHLWRRGGLRVDIVVLRLDAAGYEEPLREMIQTVLRDINATGYLGRSGGIHLLSSDHIHPDSRRGLEAAAHVVLDDDGVALSAKLDALLDRRILPPLLEPSGAEPRSSVTPRGRPDNLLFDNGVGGFDPATGDYIVYLENGVQTPAPWCNVLANEEFGTLLSESSLGFTWAINSGENRLTPCSNDPVLDTPGEILYLRDEVTASLWTVTPTPLGGSAACQIRHGPGFTRWQRDCHGLQQDLLVFVPPQDPVKLLRLRLTNATGEVRRLTATYYVQWLLGALSSQSGSHIICEYDPTLHAIIANNAWHADFGHRIAFVSSTCTPHSVSGDRYDFLGHEGTLDSPAGLRRMDLGGGFNRGGDACAAYQIHLNLDPGESAEVVFMLGQGATLAETSALIQRYQDPQQVSNTFHELEKFWADRLDAIQVNTPDPAFDLMVNRWLIYQTMASRILARAGFYQASGAYGFRDQLQDCLAILHIDPQRVRSHILRAAAHQFEEGDVLHWWHTPSGRGVRTRCSDDFIWLAYVTARYVEASADIGIFDSVIPFLMAPLLREDEQDRYARFDNGKPATLFEHCARALDHMMATGAHGLPLMGSGDWNDGMDRVGVAGRGESIWLAWFQIATIDRFAPFAIQLGHTDSSARWGQYAQRLKEALDQSAWDGEWYIRAFDDNGEPWGSSKNDQCKIDSIAQSWAVLAGFGTQPAVKTAMASARQKLLQERERLVLLLDPPFEQSTRDPGYIQAYPPGVRENGGQYSHAAAWLGLAFASQRDGDMAWLVFDILNSITRSTNREEAIAYAREPYVIAGDVCSQGANKGHGGWSWYTGAAGWTWQLGVEGILGISVVGGELVIDPCLPRHWGTAEASIKNRDGIIHVIIEDPEHLGHGVLSITVDGHAVTGNRLAFPTEGGEQGSGSY